MFFKNPVVWHKGVKPWLQRIIIIKMLDNVW